MTAACSPLVTGSGHVFLNAESDTPDRMTAIVVAASKTAAGGVIAVLRDLGLCFSGDGRSALYVEDAASLLGGRALRRFPAPRLIVISHDPVVLIEEFSETERNPSIALACAKNRIDLIFKIAMRSQCPVLILSHGLACGPLAELATVVGPFCGVSATGGKPLHGASADVPPSTAVRQGIVALRVEGERCREDAVKTIVIGGPPRSGTSMIAAVLHAAGLPLGDDLVPSTFENVLQNILFKTSNHRTWTNGFKGSWKAAVTNPRHFGLAWHGFDVPGIKALIATRRRDGPVWGIKRPGIGSFIRLGGLRLLDRPRLIMSLRDPVAIAARIALAHELKAEVALPMARWFLLDSLKTARSCGAPTLLVSHDMFRTNLPGLFRRLLAFSGLEVDASRYDEIAAFVERSGAAYRKDFAQPIAGEILHFFEDNLYGWIEEGQERPVVVEIFADDRRIVSGLADEVLDDGRILFVIHLPSREITSSTRIRAVVSQSQVELRNSGFTLAELRRS